MTIVRFHPAQQQVGGEARVPYSKPHMQRAILLSLLTNAPSIIVNPAWSSEAERLYLAARQFGLEVLHGSRNRLVIKGVGKSLNTRRSAITAVGSAFNFRTIAGLACLSPGETVLQGDASMLARPVTEHLSFISDLGGRFENISDANHLRVRIAGTRRFGGRALVDTRHSSQVLTAVLLISPLAAEQMRVRVTGNPVGEGYVDLTLEMMREQGATVERDGLTFVIEPSAYQSRVHHIASDFTALSYLAGAVVTGNADEVVVRDYYPSALSSEFEFLKTLDLLGVHPTYDPVGRSLRLNRGNPSARRIEIDGENMPTVVPTLLAMAPYLDAEVTLRKAAHVNNHKCRRIDVMISALRRMGCDIEPTHDEHGQVDGFTTGGAQRPAGGVQLDSHGDHRIFMSLATAAIGAQRPTTISGAEHLHASFPKYLEVMSGIGVSSESNESEIQLMNVERG